MSADYPAAPGASGSPVFGVDGDDHRVAGLCYYLCPRELHPRRAQDSPRSNRLGNSTTCTSSQQLKVEILIESRFTRTPDRSVLNLFLIFSTSLRTRPFSRCYNSGWQAAWCRRRSRRAIQLPPQAQGARVPAGAPPVQA